MAREARSGRGRELLAQIGELVPRGLKAALDVILKRIKEMLMPIPKPLKAASSPVAASLMAKVLYESGRKSGDISAMLAAKKLEDNFGLSSKQPKVVKPLNKGIQGELWPKD
jgi:hypothetical protein